ncbi:hypothetical protein DL96DRAFT_1576378 [Flagelloscypha sp. PMI_526]|nr:hypothetical protein DL96DRAFT_1576378 [Flagelloscypha sp. PMI_526]
MSHSPSTLSSSSTSSSISTRIDVTFADKEILDITQKIDDMKSTIASLKARIFAAKELLFSFVMSPSSAVWADQETAFQALHAAQARLSDLETQLSTACYAKAQLPNVRRSPTGTLPSESGITKSVDGSDTSGESSPQNATTHLPAASNTVSSTDTFRLADAVRKSANLETHPKPSNNSKVTCPYPGCGARVVDIYQHKYFKHGGAKRLTCDRCGWQTVYPQSFRAHQLQGSKLCTRRQLELNPKATDGNITAMEVS